MKHDPAIVFETYWFNIEKFIVEEAIGMEGQPYYRINAPDGVTILAITENDEVLLVKQFRPAIDQFTLEFPSGGVEEGESPLDAIQRELLEETGYECAEVIPLSASRIMTNRYNCHLHVFLGKNAKPANSFNQKEVTEVRLTPLTEFRRMVMDGEFEQIAGLGAFVLAYWKFGINLL